MGVFSHKILLCHLGTKKAVAFLVGSVPQGPQASRRIEVLGQLPGFEDVLDLGDEAGYLCSPLGIILCDMAEPIPATDSTHQRGI